MIANLDIANHDRIRVIAINRPARRNAVDGPTARALFEAFTAFDADDGCDVAILTGNGGAFCAGADLQALAAGGEANPLAQGGIGSIAPMRISRLRLSKPVIAAIEGHAVAGGMELALWCDLRVMARDAVMGIFCRRFGVPLIDLGTVRLPRLIGQSRALDLILTGRPVDAQEAFEIGLANRIAEPGEALDVALALARQIASHPQQCMRNDRASVLQQWGLDEEAALRNEFRLGSQTLASGETLSGARRFAAGAGRHGKFGESE